MLYIPNEHEEFIFDVYFVMRHLIPPLNAIGRNDEMMCSTNVLYLSHFQSYCGLIVVF